jgi:hypothetical protein
LKGEIKKDFMCIVCVVYNEKKINAPQKYMKMMIDQYIRNTFIASFELGMPNPLKGGSRSLETKVVDLVLRHPGTLLRLFQLLGSI